MDDGFRSEYRITQQLLVMLFATKLKLSRRNIFNPDDNNDHDDDDNKDDDDDIGDHI